MNYLERLSSGDVKTICELIGPRELKQNFRANSNGFNVDFLSNQYGDFFI